MPRGGHNTQRGGGNKKMTYKQKSSISYVQASDPPFLRAIKEKMGYQEPTLEDKDEDEEQAHAGPSEDPDDIRNMKKEDRPQIVVINPDRHVSEVELDEEVRKKIEEDDQKKIEEGRITFKKPTKRVAVGSEEDTKRKKLSPSPTKSHESRLLSFGEDEED